jgi:hypothetical protein
MVLLGKELNLMEALVPTVLFWITMLSFLYFKERRYKWLNRSFLLLFFVQAVRTTVLAESLELKAFVILLILSTVVLRFLVIRRRKQRTKETPSS